MRYPLKDLAIAEKKKKLHSSVLRDISNLLDDLGWVLMLNNIKNIIFEQIFMFGYFILNIHFRP